MPRGGAAIYSAGTTTFHEKADFLGNGQYDADASGYEPSNEDGGALANAGTMTVSEVAGHCGFAGFVCVVPRSCVPSAKSLGHV